MSFAHIHLLLNHVPTLGTPLGLLLLLVGARKKSADLKQAALFILVSVALLTIPTYLTGNSARDEICKAPLGTPANECPEPYPGVSQAAAEAHESAAIPALALLQVAGAFAWLGLWQTRRFSKLPSLTLNATVLCSVVAFAMASRAALLGGEIHHGELLTTPAAPGFARAFGFWVVDTPWMWPTLETIHFLGLSLTFGVTALLDGRMLGLMPTLPFRALHRLLPWGVLGFALSVATGMIFFVGHPQDYDQSLLFYLKIALVLASGVNMIYFTVFEEPWTIAPGGAVPFRAKAVAAATLLLTGAALYCGRMLPFLGTSF